MFRQATLDREIGLFIRSFGERWFIYMSGIPSVPAAILASLADSTTAKIGLAITAIISLALASFFVWRQQFRRWQAETHRVAALEDRLTPKLSVSYNDDNINCRSSPILFGDRSEAICFRLKIENIMGSMIENCQGTLAEVRKIGSIPEISATRLTWATMPGPRPLANIIMHAPQYLDVVRVHNDNRVVVATEGQAWPLSQARMFENPGEYLFRVIISGKDVADTPSKYIKFTLTGDWRTASVSVKDDPI
jgi:hypothetical protein